jgi:hypothetical protein
MKGFPDVALGVTERSIPTESGEVVPLAAAAVKRVVDWVAD